jgi:hypothetical protein
MTFTLKWKRGEKKNITRKNIPSPHKGEGILRKVFSYMAILIAYDLTAFLFQFAQVSEGFLVLF